MLNVGELNSLNREEFLHLIGPVFEHSPWIAERAWEQRPFASRANLHHVLCNIVRAADSDAKLALIRAHPDLVGNATLTRESEKEQTVAGLNTLSPDEAEQFRTWNSEYRNRFGFPFVICARLNKKDAIMRAFPERLKNSTEQEVETALEEIFNIADLRLRDIIT